MWIHHNLRLAYVAQHSMHHLEDCLDATPVAYIQRRFADGIDKELANLSMMKLTDEEEKLRNKKGNVLHLAIPAPGDCSGAGTVLQEIFTTVNPYGKYFLGPDNIRVGIARAGTCTRSWTACSRAR